MPFSLDRIAVTLLSGFAICVAPLAIATVVTPAAAWAACDPQPTDPAVQADCPPDPAVAPPVSPPVALPPLPALSPSDVDVNVTLGQPSFDVSPPSIGWPWPQVCGPNIQTPIPFVGFQPCI